MASISARRLAKELREIQAEGCPVGESFVRLLPVSTVLDYIYPGFFIQELRYSRPMTLQDGCLQ